MGKRNRGQTNASKSRTFKRAKRSTFKRRRRKRRARPYRRKRTRKRKSRIRSISDSGVLPSTLMRALDYATSFQLDAAALGINELSMNLNDLYDPDPAIGGHQPFGMDQLAPFYRRYTVIGCSYSIHCGINDNSGTEHPYVFYTYTYSPDNLMDYKATTSDDVIEFPGYRYKLLDATSDQSATIKGYIDMKKLFKTNSLDPDTNPEMSALFGASPAKVGTIVFGQAAAGNTNPSAINCMLKMRYIVKFSDPHNFARS